MKIFVTAKPNAGEDKIEKIDETHFIISVKEPPIQGRANRAISKVLAQFFDLPPSQVQLVSGYSSKLKVFKY